jgi:hypothetical protein
MSTANFAILDYCSLISLNLTLALIDTLRRRRAGKGYGAGIRGSTHVVPRLRRCKHPEFPASRPGQVHVCAFR